MEKKDSGNMWKLAACTLNHSHLLSSVPKGIKTLIQESDHAAPRDLRIPDVNYLVLRAIPPNLFQADLMTSLQAILHDLVPAVVQELATLDRYECQCECQGCVLFSTYRRTESGYALHFDLHPHLPPSIGSPLRFKEEDRQLAESLLMQLQPRIEWTDEDAAVVQFHVASAAESGGLLAQHINVFPSPSSLLAATAAADGATSFGGSASLASSLRKKHFSLPNEITNWLYWTVAGLFREKVQLERDALLAEKWSKLDVEDDAEVGDADGQHHHQRKEPDEEPPLTLVCIAAQLEGSPGAPSRLVVVDGSILSRGYAVDEMVAGDGGSGGSRRHAPIAPIPRAAITTQNAFADLLDVKDDWEEEPEEDHEEHHAPNRSQDQEQDWDEGDEDEDEDGEVVVVSPILPDSLDSWEDVDEETALHQQQQQ